MSNYNTDQQLWANFKQSRSNLTCGGALLSIHDGMVGNGMVVLARFPTTRDAERTLKAAGFVKTDGRWK